MFNALTGLRAKVGKYAGVTVERKEGRLLGAPAGTNVRLLDLPGTYSLSPQSLDEQISRDVLLNRLPELAAPSLLVVVVDASNLQRNLYYATQVIELGHPTLIALNMVDVAESNGQQIDVRRLAAELGVPVLPMVASEGRGVPELRDQILVCLREPAPSRAPQFCALPDPLARERDDLATLLARIFHERRAQAAAEALLILSDERALASSAEHYPAAVQGAVASARRRFEVAGVDWRGAGIVHYEVPHVILNLKVRYRFQSVSNTIFVFLIQAAESKEKARCQFILIVVIHVVCNSKNTSRLTINL